MKSWEYRKISFADRVFMHIEIDEVTGCHEFRGRKDGHGYGQIKNKGHGVLVHRWIWEQRHGSLSMDQQVLHKCDNPGCVNLDHLFLGDHATNMADKAAKGRSKNVPRGFAHKRPMAKVTQAQVIEIKALLARGYRQADVARDFRLSRQLVSDISLGKTWKHVDGL